jgi:lysophospholipase
MRSFLLAILVAFHAGAASSPSFHKLAPTQANPYGLTTEKQFDAVYAEIIEPELLRGTQGTFTGVRGVQLHYRWFPPLGGTDKGAIVISSGRTEGLIIYAELIHDLRRQGYWVYIHDHRGQGLSGGRLAGEQRGHVVAFDDYVADLKLFVDTVVLKQPHQRRFLLAHSMGGGIASLFLEKYPGIFQAAALVTPMHDPLLPGPLTSSDRTKAICKASLHADSVVKPSAYAAGQDNYAEYGFEDERNDLTHSPVRWRHTRKMYATYKGARVGGPSHRWIREACSASIEARENAGDIHVPVLLIQAGNDNAVRNEAQEQFCKATPNCDGFTIPGAWHALFIERDDFRLAALNKTIEFFDRESRR